MEDRLKPPIEVLYRDDDWFLVNKPYDCRITDYPNCTDPTVQSILREQYPEIPKFRNVHQLDYATSGVFVLALNKKAAATTSKLFTDRAVKKTYLALVNGHLKEDSYFVDQPIDDDPNHEFRMAITGTGRSAQTDIKILQRGYYHFKEEKTGIERIIPVTKVILSPITGRRHQLRLHLKFLGHPIVGDFNYEESYTDTYRMMLHAYKIVLPLPNREQLKVIAKDPFTSLVIEDNK